MVIAEAPILETLIYKTPPGADFVSYLAAISEVHGWKATQKAFGIQIKSPDLAAPVVVPKVSLTEEDIKNIQGEGWGVMHGNDFSVIRAPQGAFLPPIRLPITLRYRVHVT